MTAATQIRSERENVATEQHMKPLPLSTIRLAQAGDRDAFEEIMLATERWVALLAWRILGDAEDSKDAVQETFLRLFRHLHKFDSEQDFVGWLYRIAVNVCRDHERRRRWRRIFTPIDETTPLSANARIDDELVARDEAALLTRGIDALPRKERLAIILRDVEELPTDQVAEILGSSPATVRVQISKARAKLRLWIEARQGRKS